MGKFAEWNPLTNNVQGGLIDGRYINGGYTMIGAGPPRLANLGGASVTSAIDDPNSDIVYPLGVTQNINHSQNKTFMRVWELGSERSYFIGGRTTGQVGLSKVFYHGPSMLRALYAYYQDMVGDVQVSELFPSAALGVSVQDGGANPHDVIIPPGYENLFCNLASDLFNQPIGLLIYMRDSNLDTIGAMYLEACYLPNHTWATDAQGTIVQETVAVQYERVVPVSLSSLPVISGLVGAFIG
jgi:hypothetical protein